MATHSIPPDHLDLLGEVSNISMGAAATALSSLLRRRVEVTTPTVECLAWDALGPASLVGYLAVKVTYTSGLEGNTYLLVREQDVSAIVDLMMGGDGSVQRPIEREMLLSAIAEAMNQMMGAAATAMAEFLGFAVNISPPVSSLFETNEDVAVLREEGDPVVRVAFRMTVEGLLETTIYQICSMAFLPRLVQMGSAAAARLSQASGVHAAPTPAIPVSGTPAHAVPAARPVAFGQLSPQPTRPADQNIELLFDVTLQVTVELGRTCMRIRDVLGLGPGAVIELDRLAGEPVDLYLNDRIFARGEVVVIEENFGVRITEILSPEARVQALASRSVTGSVP